ncbi:putative enoyl-CoA hydratase 1 [Sinobacterium norvegicum]|uniref:Enoyl-CoA hydratase 1 n=1 Tax=Sinobacterium norvegicum TaxID=1641715 RepID=A0ABM9AG22_9GAMM|nr:MaoC family dehydratase [Sinobacterium norvegicum]CAH0991967.1 putative enoyl-CoA hydratase 1 [Sinobacterium norvegicum]
MKQYQYNDIDTLQEIVSEEFGEWSQELEITQGMIDQFAELTGDDYWLHTDPDRCKGQSPFGCTIAHGFLTLVLLPKLTVAQTHEVVGFNNMLNYGSNKLRFTGTVMVNNKIHARSRVKEVIQTPKGQTIVTMEQHVNVVGQDRPAVIYELMFMYM